MNIPSNRNPLNTPQMRVGDPIAAGNYLRSSMDQSEPYDSPPVQPSIRDGHLEPESRAAQVTRRVKAVDSALEAAAWHKAEADRYFALYILSELRRHEAAGERAPRELDSFTQFELDMAIQNAKAWRWNREKRKAEYQS